MLGGSLTGLAELQAKTQPAVLLSPLKGTYQERYSDLVGRISAEAPRDTGTLAGSYRSEVDSGAVPAWGQITSSVRYGPYVHRHNPFVARAAAGALGRLNSLLEVATRAIEGIWGS